MTWAEKVKHEARVRAIAAAKIATEWPTDPVALTAAATLILKARRFAYEVVA